MSDTRDDFGPCECGQSTIRGCAEMQNRHCGLKELSPFDEIEALRTQLATALDRETATTARYDARMAELEAKIAWYQAVDEASYDGFLRAENARLREALRPYVTSHWYADKLADDASFPDEYYIVASVTLGDFRRAREALEEPK